MYFVEDTLSPLSFTLRDFKVFVLRIKTLRIPQSLPGRTENQGHLCQHGVHICFRQ